jgi:transposase InsO family protein
VYNHYIHGQSIRSLAESYHVDKVVIQRIVERGRRQDFSVHDSTNERYRTVEYGLKRLAKTEVKVQTRLARIKPRYERSVPGELVHADTKRLPFLAGESKARPREVLFVAIDDMSRWLVADILPDRTAESAAVFGRMVYERVPFPIEDWYSDNGTEWKGTDHHAFVGFLRSQGSGQKFTKVKHPWTNGKAERVIRTLMEEWYVKERFSSRAERRSSLYRFVDRYNHERTHLSLNNQTPTQRLSAYYRSGDNA